MHFHPARLNAHKRDGGKLSADQIRDVVHGAVDGSLSDAQLGAFLMAVCCRGMDAEETATLTLAMRDSGEVLGSPSVPGPSYTTKKALSKRARSMMKSGHSSSWGRVSER